ncbi:MAG: hypothetical protein EDX89_05660 [Acidobacteria bacterium]|nr:MAG: hypothetical protein EDX89_05660 [Acidobacteriota bacterium]
MSSIAFSKRKFNPDDGDAIWTLGSSLSASWTLTIRNAQDQVVRTLTGGGTSVGLSWDGKDGGGTPQPDGTFNYLIEADAGGGQVGTPAKGMIYLDRTFSVEVTAPGPTALVSNVLQNGATDVPVTGTVTMANLSSWTLDYGTGANPTSWTTIVTSSSPVSNGTLGTWATLPLANGLYSLRLTAADTYDNYTVVVHTPTVGNFTASQNVLQINASQGQTVTYASIVPFAVTTTLRIKNEAGQTVRTATPAQRTTGSYNDVWDGRNDQGQLVSDGAYFYLFDVTDGSHSMTWDRTTAYLNNFSQIKDGLNIQPFDPFNNQPMTFTYNFPQAGQVSVALSPPGQGYISGCDPPKFCLFFNKYEESGPHTVTWAGVDPTGALRTDVTVATVITQRYAFSQNAVVVFGIKPTITGLGVTPAYFEPLKGSQTVSFTLATYQSQTASVTVTFQNQASLSVLKTLTAPAQSPGPVSLVWDGRADNGMYVAAGPYTVTATVLDSLGNEVRSQVLTMVYY